MSKYDPLREHLARLDDVVWSAKLEELEAILGTSLPKSAREHRTWWANSGGSLVHQNAWLDAGWRVERTDLGREMVIFRRLRIGGTLLAATTLPKMPEVSNGSSGRLDIPNRILQELRQSASITLRAEWTPVGILSELEDDGPPATTHSLANGSANGAHPGLTSLLREEPGICRILSMQGENILSVIASTDNLRRFATDLKNSLKQMASAEELSSEGLAQKLGLEVGTSMEIDIVSAGNAWLISNGRGKGANMADERERKLVGELLCMKDRQSGLKVRFVTEG